MAVRLRYEGSTGLSARYEITALLGGDVISGALTESSTGVYTANPTGLGSGHHTARVMVGDATVQVRPMYVSGGSDGSPGSTPTNIQTSPEMPLLWVLCRLEEAGVYLADQLELGIHPEPDGIPGDQWGRARYDHGGIGDFNDGMGGFGIGITPTAVVRCYLRSDVDPAQVDTAAMAVLYRVANDVTVSLHGRHAEDAAGNFLTTEPVMVAGWPVPRRYRDRQWIYVDVPFSLSLMMGSQASASPTEC